ncbi:MAG TPA: cation:proton antiporter, partial [Polyangiaceae bacterium]|nr:cation:proton antiporter [Polyangiaceae bacterium]
DTSAALRTVGLTVAFVAIMVFVVRPLAAKLVRRISSRGELSQTGLAIVCVGLLVSALATEAIGIHALFGAFLFGAVIRHDSALAEDVRDKLTDVVVVLFLPAFFAFTGLRTELGLVSGAAAWAITAVILLVAAGGKVGGAFVAARFVGLGSRDAAALGVLMNTRGLMELIVLNVGLDLGVISPTLFTMLVFMAVATTFATTPLLRFIKGGELRAAAAADVRAGQRAH